MTEEGKVENIVKDVWVLTDFSNSIKNVTEVNSVNLCGFQDTFLIVGKGPLINSIH